MDMYDPIEHTNYGLIVDNNLHVTAKPAAGSCNIVAHQAPPNSIIYLKTQPRIRHVANEAGVF